MLGGENGRWSDSVGGGNTGSSEAMNGTGVGTRTNAECTGDVPRESRYASEIEILSSSSCSWNVEEE